MKTKTPEQIHKQAMRILHAIAAKNWDGVKYRSDAQRLARMKKIGAIARQWIDNIYHTYGFSTNGYGIATSGTTARINHAWSNAAAPRAIYAGY